MYDRHISPRLGTFRLIDLRPEVIGRFAADLRAGGVGEPTVYRMLVLLQGILQRAVEWERLAANPVRAVRKPAIKRTREVRPLPPLTVERMRAFLLGKGKRRDARSSASWRTPGSGRPRCWRCGGTRSASGRF